MSKCIGAATLLVCDPGGAVISEGFVKYEDELIVEVGEIKNLPPGEKEKMDYFSGATLMPGLINAHDHLVTKSKYTPWVLDAVRSEPISYQTIRALRNAQGLLKDGVTTLRECGCRDRSNISIARAVKNKLVLAPDILACGKPISMLGGHCYYYSYEVSSPAEVVAAVRGELKEGADFIKVHATGGAGTLEGDPRWAQLSVEELTAAAQEAHKENKRVCSHAIGRPGIINTLDAGIDTLEHGHYLDDELLERMCKQKTYYVPTLTGYIPLARKGLSLGRPAWQVEKARLLLEEHQRVMSLLKKYPELELGAGTDSTGEMADEIMEMAVSAGFSNAKTLIIATLGSARVLGIEEKTGTLERGKRANLIVADGNLLEDLKGLKSLKRVIKAGETAV
jgi:imidazolonepropionase-like amidohydrolase